MALSIKWQRLVEESETCSRCSSTEDELEDAVQNLEESLSALDVDVELEKEELTKSEFEQNPTESNLILINEKPLEDWLGGEVGQSECCDVCGDEDCRTVTINGKEYEVIPADLIVKAGLTAASQTVKTGSSCCSNSSDEGSGCCG
ncbi:DUF2703 domain-containing protein [Candidatus Bipolaricaulota bacterium]|nr:DUF2703 domain-containing protein [Candidatus Bipolaricaulota bacterium]